MTAKPKRLWRAPIAGKGVGGIAADAKYVVASGRALNDTLDLWRCYDAATGAEVWTLRYPAAGKLDYGSSPRATPLLHDGRAFLAGAFGHLHAVDLATGRVLWKKDLAAEYPPAREMTWGLCASPLIADGKLIVCPGSNDALLVALDTATGAVVWKSPGGPAGYGSFLLAELGGKRQIVGLDAESLGGWDPATGKRLWRIQPEHKGDFNVPTPVVAAGMLIFATEGNATRAYRFRPDGTPDPMAVAVYESMAPETASPVAIGDRMFGLPGGLHCINVSANLKPVWVGQDDELGDHASLIASGSRVLIVTMTAEAILIDATANTFRILGRHKLVANEDGVYAHPAVVGTTLYLRGSDAVYAFELSQ
ncbi:MAG: PQQ-binding-like beta-propeller repeat protein [Gemmataceae bacterium]